MFFVAIEPAEPPVGPVSHPPHRFTRRYDFLNYGCAQGVFFGFYRGVGDDDG
jgi:hypothetical protein